jgi:NAD(P)-dependent dehydrogenase (short-subunit alcohol dehydrogenase family)
MRVRLMRTVAGMGGAAVVTALARRRSRTLRGRVAVVTGGSRGLGLAITRELVAQGCRVVICARDEAELSRAASGLRAAGGEVLPVVCDVADQEQAAELAQRAIDWYGAVDVLVNNAGIIQVGPLDALTVTQFRDAMDPMLWGMVNMSFAVLPHMRARGSGHLCNITSIGGKVSVPHLMPYCTAKFAAVGFSEGLHTELARHGIGVTTVVPGLMRTGSDLQATFAGQASREYTWFALGAATPLLSMDGRRAARRIVRAIAARRAEIILTLPARAAVLAHGVAPAATQRVLTVVNRLLPAAPGGAGATPETGVVAAGHASSPVRAATMLNRRAGRALNQPEPARRA